LLPSHFGSFPPGIACGAEAHSWPLAVRERSGLHLDGERLGDGAAAGIFDRHRHRVGRVFAIGMAASGGKVGAIHADGPGRAFAIAPGDGGAVVAGGSVGVGIEKDRTETHRQLVNDRRGRVGRQSRIGDTGRATGCRALPPARAHHHLDGKGALLVIDMAPLDAVAAISGEANAAGRGLPITPVDRGRERACPVVRAGRYHHPAKGSPLHGAHALPAGREHRLDSHGEALADRAIAVIAVAGRAGDRGGANGEGRAGSRGAGDRGSRSVPIFVGRRRRPEGDAGPLWTGSIHRDGGGESSEAQVLIPQVSTSKLVGPHIAGTLPVVGTTHAALIGLRTVRGRDLVDGRAPLLQGHGLGWPSIIGQTREQRIGVLQAARGNEYATVIARQIVAIVNDGGLFVAVDLVLGHDAPEDGRPRSSKTVAPDASPIVTEGAVTDRRRSTVEDAISIVAEGAVGNTHRCATIVDSTVASIIAEGAVADAY